MDHHLLFAVLGGLIGVVGYVLYLRTVFLGTTKPHIFTWLIYALIDAIVFTIQLISGGGPGAWVLFVSVVGNTVVALSCIRSGERRIAVSDWISFLSALVGIVLWQITDNPFIAIVILTITNTLAVLPTLRKSFNNPYEESVTVWGLDLFRFSLSLAALTSLTLTTALFPVGVLVTNGTLVATILIRRRLISKRI